MTMNTRLHAGLAVLVLVFARNVCAADGPAPSVPAAGVSAAKEATVRQIEWEDLLPKEERENFNSGPPAPIHDYLGGSAAALQSGSLSVNLALNGVAVKIPGFVVPLDVSADGMVKEFFLVPYFGACIHVPPPPPNQIVYVKLAKGVKINLLYDAQWITGRLRTESKNSRYGAAAYTLDGDKVERYTF
jgi:hypothetical protein